MLFTFPSRYWFTIGLSGVFSLTGWSRQFHAGFLVSRVTQDTRLIIFRTRKGLSPAVATLSSMFRLDQLQLCRSYNPMNASTYMVWAIPCSLATTGGITVCFLLLWVLRCFSSPRLPSLRNDIPSGYRVAPFGYRRINSYLQIPDAFRSLSRPSSPLRA